MAETRAYVVRQVREAWVEGVSAIDAYEKSALLDEWEVVELTARRDVPGRLRDRQAAMQQLSSVLMELRDRAGKPSYRELSKRMGVSHTTIGDTLIGKRVPSWEILRAIGHVLGADIDEIRRLWEDSRQ